jgi:hypothetical protein
MSAAVVIGEAATARALESMTRRSAAYYRLARRI